MVETDNRRHLDDLGQSLGFFERFADSFWKSTEMELDLIHRGREAWGAIAGRIRGTYCRNLATQAASSDGCERCFSAVCTQAIQSSGFYSDDCFAGRRFSVCSLGQIHDQTVLLLAGRVAVSNPQHPQEGGKSGMAYEAALDLLDLSLPYLQSRISIEAMLKANKRPPLVRAACQFIDNHYREKIDLLTIANACGVSQNHLCHYFSKQTGNPPGRYLSSVRIGHAMYLLQQREMSVKDVCFEVGFQSVSQFNRTFRSLQGMSPTEYLRTLPAQV